MGVLKTSLLILTLAIAAPPAMASVSNEGQLRLFASCTGRLSALREFQWNGDTAASEGTARKLAALSDLLAAVTPAEGEARALAWRVEAKAAQRGLLNEALYRQDPRLSAQAHALIDHCLRLLP